MTMISF